MQFKLFNELFMVHCMCYSGLRSAVYPQVKFVMSNETNLADLLALNLHNFEDEVRNIVDKASKELSMEKTLGELDVTWSQMEFENETHNRTGYKMLKSSEELVETLEDNQVTHCTLKCRMLAVRMALSSK